MPGSPAWVAGIEPGDEIIRLGDRENPSFTQLRGGVTLGDLEKGIPCVVRRAADGQEVELTLTPKQGKGLAKVGIAPPFSVTLGGNPPAIAGSPAALAKAVDPPAADDDEQPGFKSGDEIVRIGDVEVAGYRDLMAQLAQHPDEPLRVTVQRPSAPSDAAKAEEDAAAEPASSELTFEVPAQRLRRVGLVMKMGPITAIQPGSVGDVAGLKVGDVISAVDGQSLGSADTLDGWDASTLPEHIRQAAAAGREVTLTVLRSKNASDSTESVEITVTPRVPDVYHSAIPPRAPMGVPALGIAYRIDSEVATVVSRQPGCERQVAARAGRPSHGGEIRFPQGRER